MLEYKMNFKWKLDLYISKEKNFKWGCTEFLFLAQEYEIPLLLNQIQKNHCSQSTKPGSMLNYKNESAQHRDCCASFT